MNKRFIHKILATALVAGMTTTAAVAEISLGKKNPDAPVDYIPKLSGLVRGQFRYDVTDNVSLFRLQNVRLKVSGNATSFLNYILQCDYGNGGKFTILDAAAGFSAAGFSATIGQQTLYFNYDNERGAGGTVFTTNSFASTYMLGYHTEDGEQVNLGGRDIGIMLTYDFKERLNTPIKLYAGVFNGTGINKLVWQKSKNFTTRIEVGDFQRGLSGAFAYYTGKTPNYIPQEDGSTIHQGLRAFDVELRYTGKRWIVDAGYINTFVTNVAAEHTNLFYVWGYYKFPINGSKIVKGIYPVLRYEYASDLYTGAADPATLHRMSVGVNLQFNTKHFDSEFRLGSDVPFFKDKPSNYGSNRDFHSQLVAELMVKF